MKKRIIDKKIIKDIACRMSDSELTRKHNLSGDQLRSIFKQLAKLRAKRIRTLAGDLKSGMARSDIMIKYQLSTEGLESALNRLLKANAISPAEFETFRIKAGMNDTPLMKTYKLSEKGLQYVFKKLKDYWILKRKQAKTEKPSQEAPPGMGSSSGKRQETIEDRNSGTVDAAHESQAYRVDPLWREEGGIEDEEGWLAKEQARGKAEAKKGRVRHAIKRAFLTEKAADYVWKCSKCGKPQLQSFDQCPECGSIASRVRTPPPLEQVEEIKGSERQEGPRRGYRKALQAAVGRIYEACSPPLKRAKNKLTKPYIAAIAGATIMALIMVVFFDVQRRADESSHSKAKNSKPTKREPVKNSEVDRPEKNSQGPLDEEFLHHAEMGNTKLIPPLLQKGANINARSEKHRRTPLMLAAFGGHVDTVRLLLEKGADVNAKEAVVGTALTDASNAGRLEVVRLLLEKGADVNAKNKDGGTALTAASCTGHLEVVRLLLEKGADVNAKEEFVGTALMMGSFHGHLEVVRLLLEKGADVNAKNKDGGTALTDASSEGRLQVVRLLLKKGADVNARTIGGTALELASKKGHAQIVDLLKAKGSKRKKSQVR
jgi:ankyrin repeat protein/rubrerythrin